MQSEVKPKPIVARSHAFSRALYHELWLANWIVHVFCDWLERLLCFWFHGTLLKTATRTRIAKIKKMFSGTWAKACCNVSLLSLWLDDLGFEYENDFSILVCRLHIITSHTHFIPWATLSTLNQRPERGLWQHHCMVWNSKIIAVLSLVLTVQSKGAYILLAYSGPRDCTVAELPPINRSWLFALQVPRCSLLKTTASTRWSMKAKSWEYRWWGVGGLQPIGTLRVTGPCGHLGRL